MAKGIIVLLFIFNSFYTLAEYKVNYIKKGRYIYPIITPKKVEISGIGMEFSTSIIMVNNLPMINIKNCGLIELPNIFDEKKEMTQKAKELKHGDSIIYKFKFVGQCVISDWQKK